MRFGLVHVDFASQRRRLKASGRWYAQFIAARAAAYWPHDPTVQRAADARAGRPAGRRRPGHGLPGHQRRGTGLRPAREAVEAAIAELGYVPNPAARTLVTRRTDAIALVIAESEERIFGEPFFAGVDPGDRRRADATPTSSWCCCWPRSGQRTGRLDRFLTRQHVDGVLLLSLHDDDTLPERIRARGLPVVARRPARSGVRRAASSTSTTSVGARLAVDHLVERGRRRIATIAGPADMVAGRTGSRATVAGLAAAGRTPTIPAPGDRGLQPGRAARPRCATLCRVPRRRRGVLRQRPDGRRSPARVARVRAAGCRPTCRWSASTTPRWRCPRIRR